MKLASDKFQMKGDGCLCTVWIYTGKLCHRVSKVCVGSAACLGREGQLFGDCCVQRCLFWSRRSLRRSFLKVGRIFLSPLTFSSGLEFWRPEFYHWPWLMYPDFTVGKKCESDTFSTVSFIPSTAVVMLVEGSWEEALCVRGEGDWSTSPLLFLSPSASSAPGKLQSD